MTIYRSPEFKRTRRAVALGAAGVFDSLGFTIWEYLNPESVRAEAEAIGRDPAEAVIPGFSDVIGAAMEDTRDVVAAGTEELREGAAAFGSGAQKIALGLGVTALIAGAIYFSQKRRRK